MSLLIRCRRFLLARVLACFYTDCGDEGRKFGFVAVKSSTPSEIFVHHDIPGHTGSRQKQETRIEADCREAFPGKRSRMPSEMVDACPWQP